MMKIDERWPVRCGECGQVIAVRSGNAVVSSLKHRNRKKEVRVKLNPGQKMWIVCEKCGHENMLTGA